MNIIERTNFAMENYMLDHPCEISEFGRRGPFDVNLFPDPKYCPPNQWCDGDLTSRTLDAWLFAREITGDHETGKEIEAAELKYLYSLIHPETGMAFVREHSYPNRNGYYYHMWDHGRVLKHLTNRYLMGKYAPDTKDGLYGKIAAMLDGCVKRSTTVPFENGGTARYWKMDAFFNDVPVDPKDDFGSCNFLNYTVASANLLDPTIKFYIATGEKKYLDLACELANGYISGLEKRREGTVPMFMPDGQFYGHVHTCISGLSGMVVTAKELYRQGNEELAKYYIDIAVRSYKWMLSETNHNRGSSCGWFPEGTGKGICDCNELCCTSDMIELAAELADVAQLIPGYEELDDLWDDADRYTVNELFIMQFIHPEKFLKFHPDASKKTLKDFEKATKLCKGGWAASRNWLHDMRRPYGGEEHFYTIGCCLYSGQRGFYSYWTSIVAHKDDHTQIRFAGTFRDDVLEMDELEQGGMRIRMKQDKKLSVRIPKFAVPGTASVQEDGKVCSIETDERGYITLDAKAGDVYTVAWENARWSIRETVGDINRGQFADAEEGKKVTFTLFYHGNKLIDITPKENALVSVFEGL